MMSRTKLDGPAGGSGGAEGFDGFMTFSTFRWLAGRGAGRFRGRALRCRCARNQWGRREANSEHGKCKYNKWRKRARRWRGGMAVGLGWDWVRLGRRMGFVCNRLRAKLGSFGNFVSGGVERQRKAAPIGRNWLPFVNGVCRRVAGWVGGIGFVLQSFVRTGAEGRRDELARGHSER